MIKKPYLRPTTNVEEVNIVQLICVSLSGANSTGLGDNETLNYGDGNTTEKNAWENAW